MLSNNIYVKYEPVNSKEEVYSFINTEEKQYSNSNTYREDIDQLMEYKEKHLRNYIKERDNGTYHNVYGYLLKILIPSIVKEEAIGFIHSYMVNLDNQYKKNLYVFRLIEEGTGTYGIILAFTRYVYQKPVTRFVRYKRNYYYNTDTNRMTTKDDPKAVLKAKKGTAKLDKDGTPLKETVSCSAKESRTFAYGNSFAKLERKLKNCVIETLKEFKHSFMVTSLIARMTVKDDDSKYLKKAKRSQNRFLTKVNKVILRYIEGIYDGGMYEDDLEFKELSTEIVCIVNNMLFERDSNREKMKATVPSLEEIDKALMHWWKINILQQA